MYMYYTILPLKSLRNGSMLVKAANVRVSESSVCVLLSLISLFYLLIDLEPSLNGMSADASRSHGVSPLPPVRRDSCSHRL